MGSSPQGVVVWSGHPHYYCVKNKHTATNDQLPDLIIVSLPKKGDVMVLMLLTTVDHVATF